MAGQAEVAFTAAGLTTATTNYSTDDMLGTELTVTNFVLANGGFAYIVGVVLEDDSNVMGPVDIYVHNASTTPAANNAAASWSDADAAKQRAIIHMPQPTLTSASGLNRTSHWEGLLLVKAGAATTSVFVDLVTRAAGFVFASGATALHGVFLLEQL